MSKRIQIKLSKVKASQEVQTRAFIDEETAELYSLALKGGAEFPPIEVFFDGTTYWLSRGFHRTLAHKKAGLAYIDCIVFEGDKRAAILHGMGDNLLHGLPSSVEDRRRAATMLLCDPEWGNWCDAEIMRRTGAGARMVADIRAQLREKSTGTSFVLAGDGERVREDSKRTVQRKNGTTYTVDTSKSGRKQEKTETVKDRKQREEHQSWCEAATASLERALQCLAVVPGSEKAKTNIMSAIAEIKYLHQ